MHDFVNWFGIINGLILLVLGLIYKRFPPKKINTIYGYRTKRSMKNQDIWDYANKIGADMIIYVGLATCLFGVIPLIIDSEIAIMTPIVLSVIFILLGYFYCEKLLRKHFDKDGNSINK